MKIIRLVRSKEINGVKTEEVAIIEVLDNHDMLKENKK